jgi:hypothetical protein
MSEPKHPVAKLAARVTDQQSKEAIAAAERKRVIARTPAILEAFAYGIDRLNPAPTQRK